MEGNEVEQVAAKQITDPKDIFDALETIKAIEMMGYAFEETTFKPRFFQGIMKGMDILRHIHDDLMQRLPADVIEQELAKAMPRPPAPQGTSAPVVS